MKRRLLLVALSAAPFAAPFAARAQTTAPAQPDEWQNVISPDLRCRLEMPVPVEKSENGEKEKGHIGPRLVWETRRGSQIFNFDLVDYESGWFSSKDTKQMARDLGRGEAEKAFPKARYKFARDEAVTLQGWDGYALDIEDAQGAGILMRTYIVRDRLYRMLVSTGADAPSKGAATRFVDSLKLAETRS
jgi:hypothetical protein